MGGSESVVLDLVPGQGYDVDNDSSTATVTIFNNDLPSVSIVADEPDATGLSGPGEFTVTRNGPTGEPLLVNYSIGGTATNGQDYQTIPGDVVIPAGSSTAAIPIDPLYVGSTSGSTTVVLTLAAGLGYSIADPASSDTVTIEDNSDPQAPPASEFYIGLGGTYAVPAGATTLYLGLHDGFDWTDNQGTVSAELTWNVGGEVNESVPATACVDFAFAPAASPGRREKTSMPIARLRFPCRRERQALPLRHPAHGVTSTRMTLATDPTEWTRPTSYKPARLTERRLCTRRT